MASKAQDAIALLKADHRKVEELFARFEKARGSTQKAEICEQICMELIIHTMIEEEIFYPALQGKVEEDTMDEAYVEHDGAKVLIAELMDGSPEDQFFDAKVTVLAEEIKHHVHEEEAPARGMFAQARACKVDLARLGAQLQQRKDELMREFSRDGLPLPMTRAMNGARLEHGQPIRM